jgi:hypothetical protein
METKVTAMRENYDFSQSILNPYLKKIQKPAKRKLINLPEEPDESAQKPASTEE